MKTLELPKFKKYKEDDFSFSIKFKKIIDIWKIFEDWFCKEYKRIGLK